jgi:hypothetical protein
MLHRASKTATSLQFVRFASGSEQTPKSTENITQLDLIKRRQEKGLYWHEEKLAGHNQKWNYRREIVQKWGLDKAHRNIWLSFGAITVVGFTAFVIVKSSVINKRKEDLAERERIRKQLQLGGVDRRQVSSI